MAAGGHHAATQHDYQIRRPIRAAAASLAPLLSEGRRRAATITVGGRPSVAVDFLLLDETESECTGELPRDLRKALR
jgi:hypothetical protein